MLRSAHRPLFVLLLPIVLSGVVERVNGRTRRYGLIRTLKAKKELMAQGIGSLSGRLAGFTSALSLGLLSVAVLPAAKAQAVAPSNTCPEPSVVVQSDAVVPVTKANYAAAETQTVFAKYIANVAKATCSGGMGVLLNDSKAADPKDRTVIRINFDTLYSWLILDLNDPATITLPEAGGRYQSAMVVDDQGYVFVYKNPGAYELTKENVGSRNALVGFRTGVNMNDPEDLAKARDLQKKLKVSQANRGEFVQPNRWNLEEMLALRSAYNQERNEQGVKSENLYGRKGVVSPEQNNMGVAVGIGGLPKEGAVYLFYTPSSDKPQMLTLKDVPYGSNAFWSLTVYDKDGFPVGDNYNVNSAFVTANDQGEAVLNFGGDSSQENYLGIYPGWNATLRIYNPTPAYFDGSWTRPELQVK